MLLLPFLTVLILFIWFGRALRDFAFEHGATRLHATIIFIVVAMFPWLDCIPGYFVFANWQRTHPSFLIHESVKADSVYLLGSDVVRLSHGRERDFTLEIRRLDSGAFGIRDDWDVPGKYLRITAVDPSDPRCVLPASQREPGLRVSVSPGKCVLGVVEREIRSEYAIEGYQECGTGGFASQPALLGEAKRRRFNDSDAFPIYGSCTRVIKISTGQVVAESWNGFYASIVARYLTMLPSFRSGSVSSQIPALWGALVPKSKADEE
jgi:hypothetical protein